MNEVRRNVWLTVMLLAISTTISCGGTETRDIPSSQGIFEVEEETRLVVGDYANLSAEELKEYRKDLQYVWDLAGANTKGRLNLADPQMYRMVTARLKIAGKSRQNSPNLFAKLDQTREHHISLGYGRGLAPEIRFRNTEDGPAEMHEIITSDVDGELGVGVGGAGSTVPAGSLYTLVDINFYDGNGIPIAPPNIVEQFAGGTDVNVQTSSDLSQTSLDSYRVDSLKIEDTGSSFNINLEQRAVGLEGEQPPGREVVDPAFEILDVTAPVDSDGDNLVKICLSRTHGDCDYNLLGMWTVRVPLAGSIHLTTPHVFDLERINAIKDDLAAGTPNHRAGYIKLVFAEDGGACNNKENAGLQNASMKAFWDHTEISPDQKTLTWDMTGPDHSALFSESCQLTQDILYLIMSLQLPVEDTTYGDKLWVAPTLSSDPLQHEPNYAFDSIRIVNSCLAAGTMIQMADGSLVAVEDVAAGDHVFNTVHDAAKGLTVMDKAVGVEYEPMVRLEAENGHSVLMTEMHPVQTPDRGMILAKELRKGDLVVTIDGVSTIRTASREQYEGKVYNVKLGTDKEKAALGTEDGTMVYANGFLVGDMQVQAKHEFLARAASTQGDVLERLPSEWHRDYQLSPLQHR